MRFSYLHRQTLTNSFHHKTFRRQSCLQSWFCSRFRKKMLHSSSNVLEKLNTFSTLSKKDPPNCTILHKPVQVRPLIAILKCEKDKSEGLVKILMRRSLTFQTALCLCPKSPSMNWIGYVQALVQPLRPVEEHSDNQCSSRAVGWDSLCSKIWVFELTLVR